MNAAPAFAPHRVTLDALACRRGERRLFAGISAAVGPGEALLLRGPNGAGKTTLLMAIAGLVRPESGRIVLARPDPEQPFGETLGLLAHQSGIKGRLTVLENLRFWMALYGAEGDGSAALDRVGLRPMAGLAAHHLSAGQTRRLALARLIAAERPIWLLDEPVAALDAAGERLVGVLIEEHLERGGLAIAATHHDLAGVDPGRIATLWLGAGAP